MEKLATIADDIPVPELVDLLTEYWKLKSDYDLAKTLEVDRRSVSQYRKRKSSDIQTRIIIELIRDIGYLEKKISK